VRVRGGHIAPAAPPFSLKGWDVTALGNALGQRGEREIRHAPPAAAPSSLKG